MKEVYFYELVELLNNYEKAVICGNGAIGNDICALLQRQGDYKLVLFDNDENKIGSFINGIEVVSPRKINGKALYIITVGEERNIAEIRKQLLDMKIFDKDIVNCKHVIDYKSLSILNEKCYEIIIRRTFQSAFGKQPDLEHPKTYSEIINYEKLNLRDPIRTKLADKYLVREWVKEKIGEKYLNKLIGVWDHIEDVDFNALPERYVLKMNNGSGRNFVIKDKRKININEIITQFKKWEAENYAFEGMEMQYKDIPPKIICEEYLDGVADDVYDYNIFCFHGEPEYIWCIKGSHKPDCKASFYNKNWEMQKFSYGYPIDEIKAPRPNKLELMLELSRKLSKDFEHVRVDWYNLPDGRVIFGEMTFSTWGGTWHFVPEIEDLHFGELIRKKNF